MIVPTGLLRYGNPGRIEGLPGFIAAQQTGSMASEPVNRGRVSTLVDTAITATSTEAETTRNGASKPPAPGVSANPYVIARGRQTRINTGTWATIWVAAATVWVWFTTIQGKHPATDRPTLNILLITLAVVLVPLVCNVLVAILDSAGEKRWHPIATLLYVVDLGLIAATFIEELLPTWTHCLAHSQAGCMPLASEAQLTSAALVLSITIALGIGAVLSTRKPIREGRGQAQADAALSTREPTGEGAELAQASPSIDGGLAICCSGGGMRSAAFCFGALHRLMQLGTYDRATHLIGTSGGGYAASAFVAVEPRRTPGSNPASFGKNSPELAFLRNHTSYLASSPRVKLDAALSLLYGLAINLLIIAVTVEYTAWITAWLLRHFGTINVRGERGCIKQFCFHAGETPAWVAHLWWAAGLVGVVFILQRALLNWRSVNFAEAESSQGPRSRAFCRKVVAWWRAHQLWPFNPGTSAPLLWLSAVGVAYAVLLGVGWTWTQVHDQSVWSDLLRTPWQKLLGSSALGAVLTGLIKVAGVSPTQDAADRTAKPIQIGTARAVAKPHPIRSWIRKKLIPRSVVAIVALVIYGTLVARTGSYLRQYPAGFVQPPSWRRLAILASVGFGMWVLSSANACSLFPFYRDRLASAFLIKTDGQTRTQTVAEHLRLSEFSARRQHPSLILCGTANVADDGLLPVGRGGASFLMGESVGLPDAKLPGGGKLVSANEFEGETLGVFSIADAIAASAAAVAPVAGRGSVTVAPFRVLMALANIRTGTWVRNPYWIGADSSTGWRKTASALSRKVDRPSIIHVLREASGRLSVFSPYLYVTDGGHYENLGLLAAFQQRATRIILLDASGDPEDSFKTMGDIMATARMDLGIEINDFNPEPLTHGDRPYAAQAWESLTGAYKDGNIPFRIDLIKAILLENASWDLKSYKNLHPEFPLTSTNDQLYNEYDFEAYRQLGYSVVRSVEAAADLRCLEHERIVRSAVDPTVTLRPASTPAPPGRDDCPRDATSGPA